MVSVRENSDFMVLELSLDSTIDVHSHDLVLFSQYSSTEECAHALGIVDNMN
jgi:hypothetical protein